ncbi:D-glycero-beta-D-manno-heptose 1-phosphate adenylyltransferase [Amycolatopsis viridis]|uniref:D-glycero-beta-D-manno-heptose 1-phosphate adenylyltransferase n=1 Tax=Amycolatopsis viridis TaxID=185678 RepID=A0ABX0SW16_9PSEU|nr:D-glycero-beta-D-manno-heptose 1-phosphate adenylyltransferase [Amycolatopsis viridis]NIH81161.1 rfaE bifunctional protein nucleotidyltransferase chain/domain/rfaE bifunctional protein kinase chain/domain [Amycolatopsis viridis]
MTGPLVVVGDTLLDIDVDGSADRLCPEAPVPVVDVGREWHRPGGAGLAARLAARSAADVVLVTALGDDDGGARLARLLAGEVELCALPLRGGTVRKTRIRAAGQSVVRLDHGDGRAAHEPLDARTVSVLRGASAILVADYGRGVADHPQIRELLAGTGAPVVWDPHPRGGSPVPGAALVTPNDSEAAKFAGGSGTPEELAGRLRAKWAAEAVAVTVGAQGAVLADSTGTRAIPVPNASRVPASVRPDTCGAGDRFASAVAAALFEGAALENAVASAVESAARFVAAGAATALSEPAEPVRAREPGLSGFELAERVRHRGGRVVATGGCFDILHPGHVALLRRARELGDVLIVCVNSDESVRRLKGPGRPVVTAADRVRVLSALESVDAVVVFEESSPVEVLRRLCPDIWVKGGDYEGTDLPEAEVVRAGGGKVVLVPTVEGYSTTRLIETVSNG